MTKAKQEALINRRIQKAIDRLQIPLMSLSSLFGALTSAILIGASDDDLRVIARDYAEKV